jgi:hypothetical protein
MLDEDVDLSQCRGFLIDGDHAIKWREGGITSLSERAVRGNALHALWITFLCCVQQGTLPFMSKRLVFAWIMGKSALHTAIDDLESFLWVLVWALVHIFKKYITNGNSMIHRLGHRLSSRDLDHILNRGVITKKRWPDRVFRDLIKHWLEISEEFGSVADELEETLLGSENDLDAQETILNDLDDRCRVAYKGFIQAGYKHLRTIRNFSEWQDVVDFDGESLNT